MTRTATAPGFNRRYLALVALLALGLYVLVPQLGDFRASWQLLSHPVPGWAAAAVLLTAATYLAAAGTYCLLAFRPLAYGQTVLVQLAAMFVNRLLPGGIGALGANYAYLHRHRHSGAQAATVPAVNNLLGMIGHILIVAVALILAPEHWPALRGSHDHSVGRALEIAAAVVLAAVVLALVVGRRRLVRTSGELRRQLFSYRHRPRRLLAALATSMLLTLANVTALGCCALAFGVHLPFVLILLIFSFGLGTGTATPTPGGLGGFEAGLTAGFVAYGASGATALAIALLYRLISYWLPLLAGAPALALAQKQHLFSA